LSRLSEKSKFNVLFDITFIDSNTKSILFSSDSKLTTNSFEKVLSSHSSVKALIAK
jgi:hypothetical protein